SYYATVHEQRSTPDADESAPGASPYEAADAKPLEHPRQRIPTRSGVLIDQHDFGPPDRVGNRLVLAFAGHRHGQKRAAQPIDDVVRNITSAVEPLIDNRSLFVRLSKVIAIEICEPVAARVGQVEVSKTTLTQLFHFPTVVVHPRTQSQ